MTGYVGTSTARSTSRPISRPVTTRTALACSRNGLFNNLDGRLGFAIRIKLGVVACDRACGQQTKVEDQARSGSSPSKS